MHVPDPVEPSLNSRPLAAALAARAELWPEPQIETGEAEAGWMTCAVLSASDAMLNGQLAYQASLTAGADPKTCAAFIMSSYTSMFSGTAVPLLIGFGMVPDLAPDKFALQLYSASVERDGKTVVVRRARVRLLSSTVFTDRQGEASHPDAALLPDRTALCAAFRRQVEAHFEPLIEALHRLTGLSRSAMWRLVGDSLSGTCLEAGRRYGCLDEARAMALAVLKEPGSPLTNREMHFMDVTVRDEACPDRVLATETFRARGGCCRFYLLEGKKLCTTCVLHDEATREEALQKIMRRRLGLPVS